MKRVAIPIDNNKLSEFFGSCSYFVLFEINGNSVQQKTIELPVDIDTVEIPAWLKTQNITDVVAYKVNPKIISLFAANKVNLFLGTSLQEPQKIIDHYLQGKLESDNQLISDIKNSNINN